MPATIEAGVREELLRCEPLRSEVSDRIEWGQMRANAPTPYLVLRALPEEPINTLSGPSSIKKLRLLVDVVGNDYGRTRNVLDLVKSAIAGPRSSIGGVPTNGTEVMREQDVPTKPIDGQGQARFRRQAEFLVWYGG